MAYIFDPIRNTFVDDEDKSFGNKFALVDMDNVNTPDLDQTPDSILRPGETLEDFDVTFRRPNAKGGRVNFALAGLAIPPLSYATNLGVAKILGITTAGLGAKELGDKVLNKIQQNPEILNDPRFKAAALAFGITIPGYIAPDADEMEREKEKIREMTKPVGFPAEPQIDVPLATGEKPEVKIDTKESFPAGETMKPIVEGFPADTEQLPIIFFNKKNKDVTEVKDTFDTIEGLYKTGRSNEIPEYRTKDFATKVKNIVDNNYGGNISKLAGEIGIERVRINSLFKKHGIKALREGNKTMQTIFLEKDQDKLFLKDLTDNMKYDDQYLIDRIKERYPDYEKNKKKFFNFKDLAEMTGTSFRTDDSKKLKTDQDFFQSKLRTTNKKFNLKTQPGFGKETKYQLEDFVKKFTKYNSSKPVAGSGNFQSKQRKEFLLKQDSALVKVKDNVKTNVREITKNVLGDNFTQYALENIGHGVAVNNQIAYPKLFKNSNVGIATEIFQDPVLNVEVLSGRNSTAKGYESSERKFYSILEDLIGKKVTDENIKIATDALNGLNNLRDQAANDKRLNTNFLKDQSNRIPKFELDLPEIGKKFKSGFLNVDMSNIDPSVSVGRILEINPDAKTLNDLSKEEQQLYAENLKQQLADYTKYFYTEAKLDKDDVNDLYETLMEDNSVKVKKASGGGVEITPLPRLNFSAGGTDNFAAELEYYFTNPDAELPKMQTFEETLNPIVMINDMIDPRNYPFYADQLVQGGIRVGEFATKILPATGQLISDLIRKPAFKITGASGQGYVQDYDELPQGAKLKGTGIFSEFLENITPTATEKKLGLDKLIEAEEQKMKDRGSTIAPKVLGETLSLGIEFGSPIFPGLKLLNSFAQARNLPNDKVTQKILEKEIDEVLETKGMNRREFLQATGAGATLMIAKMLGFGDDFAKTAKVARTASSVMDTTVEGMPAWFKDSVYAIERKGLLKSRGDIKGIEPDFFEITLDTKLGKKKVLMSKNNTNGEITLDWTTSYYDTELPVTITYRPGQQGKQNFLSDPEIPQSVEKYDVEVEAPEFEYKTVDAESMGPEDANFDSAINLDIKEEADAVVEALEELGIGLTKKQKEEAAENFKYYNDVELDEGSGPDTMNPIDENDAFPFLDEIERNK